MMQKLFDAFESRLKTELESINSIPQTDLALIVRSRQIQAALQRFSQGTYGLCCRCEDEMDHVLLDRDPAAVFCSICGSAR